MEINKTTPRLFEARRFHHSGRSPRYAWTAGHYQAASRRNGDADSPMEPITTKPRRIRIRLCRKSSSRPQAKKSRRPSSGSKREGQSWSVCLNASYGRIPETVPDVKWEVVETREVEAGGKPAIQKHIIGTVDNSACPEIESTFRCRSRFRRREGVPVLMTFGWTPFEPNPLARFARRGSDDGPRPPTKRDLLIAAGWGCGRSILRRFKMTPVVGSAGVRVRPNQRMSNRPVRG